MPTASTYITLLATPPRKVYAIEYLADRSNQDQVIRFLEEHAHSKVNPRKAGGAYELIGISDFHLLKGWAPDQWIHPGSMVFVYLDTRSASFMGRSLFFHYFKLFDYYTPKSTPKDPTVTPSNPLASTTSTNVFVTPAPSSTDSEYDTNISKVYDALAILRVDPREQDFEFAAKEIMGLLAFAFDEGYDLGIEVGQTNPYKDWVK